MRKEILKTNLNRKILGATNLNLKTNLREQDQNYARSHQ